MLVGGASNLKNPLQGMISGGIGAPLGETIAENLPVSLTPETRMDIARIGTAVVSLGLRQDVNASVLASTNALENNFNSTVASNLAQSLSEEEFTQRALDEWESTYGPLSTRERERYESKFRSSYYTFRMIDLSRSMTQPGMDRFNFYADLPLEGLRTQMIKDMGREPSSQEQDKFDRTVKSQYQHFQAQKVAIGIGVAVGIGSLAGRGNLGGKTSSTASSSRSVLKGKGKVVETKTTTTSVSKPQSMFSAPKLKSDPNHANQNVPRTGTTKKPIQEVSNERFVQDIATRAEKKVGGRGPVAGTKKHTYAKKLGKRGQKRFGERGLEFEQGYKNGAPLRQGDSTKGSTRLDVYDNNTQTVYDYKFVQNPGKGLKPKQIQKIQKQGPEKIKRIVEINPGVQ